MRWLNGIINSVDEFEQGLGDGEEQASLVCAVHGVARVGGN